MYCCFVGTHKLEVQYAGQSISGSPIITEVFDPSKILVEGTRTGLVGEPVLFDSKCGLVEFETNVRKCGLDTYFIK